MACPVKLPLTMILYGFFLFSVICSSIQHVSRGCRFVSYRFFLRNVAQLVRATHCQRVLQKSHYSQTFLNYFCYYSAVVTLNIAITIVNVPYEGFGSSFYYIIAYKGK